MRVTIVGCSGSFAGPDSPASSYLVQADHEDGVFNLVLDLGNGSLGALQRHIGLDDVGAVALTHLHPDHCVDLCGLYVARKYRIGGMPEKPLPVHGPEAAARWLLGAYPGLDEEAVRAQFDFQPVADGQRAHIGPFAVTAYRVNHPIEAYGFRVEAGGKVLAYSGDTDACESLGPLFTGADLVLADSAFVDGRDAAEGIHLSGSRAARAAVDAGGVRRLMLTHIPPWNDREVCRAQAAVVWPGEVELAEPDATYDV